MDDFTYALYSLLHRRQAEHKRPPADEITQVKQSTRLEHVEEELTEVRGRINGLLFVVMGAVVVQLVLMLLE